MGDEYSDVYDENGNLIPQRLDIPDYDPTIPLRRRRAVTPAPAWPDVRRLAPFRLIVSRQEVAEGGPHFVLQREFSASVRDDRSLALLGSLSRR